jgi:hypothetical protein
MAGKQLIRSSLCSSTGEFVASAFFSRNWQLRDAAAGWLADLVTNGRLAGGASSGEKREVARWGQLAEVLASKTSSTFVFAAVRWGGLRAAVILQGGPLRWCCRGGVRWCSGAEGLLLLVLLPGAWCGWQ